MNLNATSRTQLEQTALAIEEARRRGIVIPKPALAEPLQTNGGWRGWLQELFPSYVTAPFADRHEALWEWVDALETGVKPRPFVALWPRGGAKSSSAELAVAYVGHRRTRKYIWYVCRTQEQADKHVATIASLLESPQLEREDALLANRKVGKYGHSKGWRRERLWTQSGLTVDALGLDTGARGAKREEARPDLIILDDVDDKHDTLKTTSKLIDTITTSLLPAGGSDCAVLFIQNLIHPTSIASRLASNESEFLVDRIVSGPYPAVDGLTWESRFDPTLNRNRFYITGGEPTWDGQSERICEQQMNDWGITAFLREAQHDVEESGGIWDHIEFRHCKWNEIPELVRGCVWCDPAVTSTDDSCSNGIIADGIAPDKTIYRVFSWEGIDTPMNVLLRSIRKAIELGFGYVGVETNQGGDLWRDEYATALKVVKNEMQNTLSEEEYNEMSWPRFKEEKAGTGTGGKVERNQRMLVDYEKGRVIHVEGTHGVLERALRRFPKEPLDIVDAAFWGWYDLRRGGMSVVPDPFAAW